MTADLDEARRLLDAIEEQANHDIDVGRDVNAAWVIGVVREARAASDRADPAPAAPDEERLTDEMVERELHRVLCQNAKHRSRFTGECRAARNVAVGLRAALSARPA